MCDVIHITTVESPIGELTLAARGERVCLLHFGPRDPQVNAALGRWYPGVPPGEVVAHPDPACFQVTHGARGTRGGIRPDRLPGRGERGMRQRHPQSLADHLGRGGRAEELAATAR